MSDEHLRIGDAEREQAAAALGEHYAQGRITADEHAERLDQVWHARTRAELQPVFRDLPGPALRTTSEDRPRSSRRGFRPPLFAILAVLLLLTMITHKPLILIGLLVVVFVVSRRRHRFASPARMQHWSR
ncbi:DUF1707 domain-containing protein [Nocardioides conyzicola]|uniref:DUF1707 domain-containing protein n=1 Tax=Nocardioides conyzicola TaxID=1651781 RepID=A0ABP8XDJ2_9ACTN